MSGIPLLLGGRPGCGKSQLAFDFANYYFNGAKRSGGNSVIIPVNPDTEILDPGNKYYTEFDMEKSEVRLSPNIEAAFHLIDEINRTPTIKQNQFYPLLNGYVSYQGQDTQIGVEGYKSVIGTANLGNGEFLGTFSMDPALENRFGIIIDFDYDMFRPTEEDDMLRDRLREANPEIKQAPKRDLTQKIIKAYREIAESSKNPGLEAIAVVDFLKFGLRNCQGPNQGDEPRAKEKIWPYNCQDCFRNPDADFLCSLSREPEPRTTQALIKYASALEYLAKLKNPKVEINVIDLIFKAFELTGAYQHMLNPNVLRQSYSDENPKMMQEVAQRLRADFRTNEDFIIGSLEKAQEGKRTSFCEFDGTVYAGYEELDAKKKAKVTKVNPFVDNREIGLSWVEKAVDLELKLRKKPEEKEKKTK